MDNQALENKLHSEARYLQISIPYDEDEGLGLINFDNGIETELQCEEGFVPPMYNSERRTLEVTVDLKYRRVLDWDEGKGYIHMWAKLCDSGMYTLLDEEKRPLYQKEGYVPNALIPPCERGFGDYMRLAIESDGSLPEWRKELDFSDFLENGKETKTILSRLTTKLANLLTISSYAKGQWVNCSRNETHKPFWEHEMIKTC